MLLLLHINLNLYNLSDSDAAKLYVVLLLCSLYKIITFNRDIGTTSSKVVSGVAKLGIESAENGSVWWSGWQSCALNWLWVVWVSAAVGNDR